MPFDQSRLLKAQRRLESEIREWRKANPKEDDPVRPLTQALDHFAIRRGVFSLLAVREIQAAWNLALGEERARMTSLGSVRKGVLDVTVGNSSLLSELKLFRKNQLLNSLRSSAAGAGIRDIRFRLGLIRDSQVKESANSRHSGADDTTNSVSPREAKKR